MLCASSPVEPGALAAGLDALRFAGLDPVTYPSAHDPGTMRRYLAGDDAMRAGDLRSALTDPGIAGILFARGGSGAQRTLEAMDWDGLAGQPPKILPPKVLAGYSDVTALLEAVAVRLGWASVFGPNVAISEGASHYSFGSLLRTLMRPEQATVIRYPQAVTAGPRHGPRRHRRRHADACWRPRWAPARPGPPGAASCCSRTSPRRTTASTGC